jgi:mono/diheme cytochrome c family protein
MNRLLIESIEGRILVGITMFVGIMILIGWVAINEEARMQSFVQRNTARAIERGAGLFAVNCAACHGPNGLGSGNKAPALNNPNFFGFDPLTEYNNALVDANRVIDSLNKTSEELNLESTDGLNPPTDERQDEIDAQLAEIVTLITEQEAIIDEARANREVILASLEPAIERGLYPQWDSVAEDKLTDFLITNGSRLGQVGWTGELRSYITTTLIHGRPGSGNVWENSDGMASWSQRAGGPLRDDEIEDIAEYILNWDKGDNWTNEDFFAVQQFGKPLADGSIPPPEGTEVIEFVGTDVDAILTRLETDSIVGDAASGEKLYSGITFGCAGCHTGGVVGPDVEGTWTRVENERLAEAQFAGYTGEQYLIDSIVLPNDYVVDGYAGMMPTNFGERMNYQELADIVEFLKSKG